MEVKAINKKTFFTLALIGLTIATIFVVGAQLVRQYLIPTQGVPAELSLSMTWTDDDSEVTVIDWGPCENSVAYALTPINITNTSNVPITLELVSQGWSPSIVAITLLWNYTGFAIDPGASVVVELVQNVTFTGPFMYDTSITAVQYES